MPIFTGFMQSLTTWLHAHPELALFITFLVSLSESLAIVGSIVPGSITMTAVGVLAGSGIMRVDLTLLAAILGAVAGDGASYILGHAFRDRLPDMWPFRRYPNWLLSGKEYFTCHGKKSVLIGRFVGPLRSIIPVIAGMMGMNRWHFLSANVISAIGWALLYVMPGVLIGAASTELSVEAATKLFVIILGVLVIAWLVSLGFIKLIIRANVWLAQRLHSSWAKLRHQRAYIGLFRLLTPRHEKNHYRTVMLPILLSICFIASILLMLSIKSHLVLSLDRSIYLFLQTLRTPLLDDIFIVISFMIKPLSLYCVFLACGLYAMYVRNLRLLAYLASLTTSTVIIAFLLKITHAISYTPNFLHAHSLVTLLTIELMIATALLGFLIFYFHKQTASFLTQSIQIVLTLFLVIAGFSSLYLGDNLFSRILIAICFGLTVTLAHWIFYRRVADRRKPKFLLVMMLGLFLTLSIFLLYTSNFNTIVQVYRPKHQEHLVDENAWWSQQEPILPLYSTSRIGKRNGVFNIQYAGSLETLKQKLIQYGWKTQSNSLFNSLVQRAEGQGAARQLPIITQLHLNKRPVINMVYYAKPNHKLFILRLWRSNYNLSSTLTPVWLGNIIAPPLPKNSSASATFKPLVKAIKKFKLRTVVFSNNSILLIKE